jgi:hypothetical protein
MLWICLSLCFRFRRQTVADVVPSLSSCRVLFFRCTLLGCRCRTLSYLWRIESLCSCAVEVLVDDVDRSVFEFSLSSPNCRRCCRAVTVVLWPSLSFVCCSLAVLSSAVAVERFRSFGEYSHFAPVLLLFLWMLWIGLPLSFRCRRRTFVAVSVRPSLSSCGCRCSSRAALSSLAVLHDCRCRTLSEL